MTYADYNIQIPNGKFNGNVACICPKCSHDRTKKTVKCLSVNLDKKLWNCHHCTWSGFLKNEPIEKIVYVKPTWKNKTELSERFVKWFESRKINQETLKYWKITEGTEFMPQEAKEVNTIQFNYFYNDELINVKYRSANKGFKMSKGAELIFYGLNHIDFSQDVYLCEGEIDCLTLWQIGFKNAMSVPNGANLNKNNLAYFDSVAEQFLNPKKVYLCFDNDNSGRKLRDEMANRIGREKCVFVEFKDCKDANDCLQKYDLQAIIESISEAKSFPLEGVFTISDISDEIDDMYVNGLDKGLIIGHKVFDEHLSFVKGYITTITGIPGHGKSDFLDEIILRMFLHHGWKTAFYSPENKPTKLHFSKMARKITGKSWDGYCRINQVELNYIKNSLNNNIWFIKPEEDFTLESILKHAKSLKVTHGIDAFVIDAWNRLEHKDEGASETKYVGKSLDLISRFCELNNMHCFLVAHPTKGKRQKDNQMKYEVPTLYDISGSANFFNKTDNGLCVYRDFEENKTYVYIQKVKFSHWGKVGFSDFVYDVVNGRYTENGDNKLNESWINFKQTALQENKEFLNNSTDIIT